jgi:phosphotriesterase-related protein
MPVMTVVGRISAQELGVTAPHEHIVIDTTNYFIEPDSITDRVLANKKITDMRDLGILSLNPTAIRDNYVLNDIEIQTKEVLAFKRAGGKTIVDATLPGIGRDVKFLKSLSADTGLHIVTGTGFYVASSHPSYINEMDIKSVANIMMDEIREGIDNTGIKPGIIGEIGIGYEIHPNEIKVLRASAEAHKESGLPLMIHINPWSTNGLQAMEILNDEKIDPGRICICHIDGENRRDYIYSLLDMGVFIEFDNFGKEFSVLDHKAIKKGSFGKFVSDWQREELLIELIDKGYEDQILVSCDVCLKIFLQHYGGKGYDHVLKNIVPELLMYGVPQNTIDKLLIENPARFLDVPV